MVAVLVALVNFAAVTLIVAASVPNDKVTAIGLFRAAAGAVVLTVATYLVIVDANRLGRK